MKHISPIDFLFIFLFTKELIYSYLTFLGYSFICPVLSIVLLLLILNVFRKANMGKMLNYNMDFSRYIIIFCIYYIYIFVYIFSTEIPLSGLQGCGSSWISLFIDLFLIAISLSLSYPIMNNCDFKRISKTMAFVVFVLLVFYVINIDPSIYYVSYIRDEDLQNYVPPLLLAKYSFVGLIASLYARNHFCRNKIVSNLLFISIALVCLYTLLISYERGPILAGFLCLIYYYIINQRSSSKAILNLLIGVFVIYYVLFEIIDETDTMFPVIGKFTNTLEDGASSRFGDGKSLFNLAIIEICKSPLVGSFFRIVASNSFAGYPHNFFLETLMTFGIIFSLPLYLLIYISIKKGLYLFRRGDNCSFVFFLFLYVFLSLMTSGSLSFNFYFWCCLGFLLNSNTSNTKNYLLCNNIVSCQF